MFDFLELSDTKLNGSAQLAILHRCGVERAERIVNRPYVWLRASEIRAQVSNYVQPESLADRTVGGALPPVP
jgi:hypothetical protein